MVKKVLILGVLSLIILGCSGVQWGPKRAQQDVGSPPVVVDHYAAQVLRVGDNWRIFLRGRDDDGDMKYIAAELYQAGVGYYRVNIIFLEGPDQEEFAGYLVLPFPVDYSFFDDRFDMRILLRDQKDNRSEALTLPLRIGHWTYEELPDQWEEVADHRLGIIILNLESSQFYNRGGNDSRPDH